MRSRVSSAFVGLLAVALCASTTLVLGARGPGKRGRIQSRRHRRSAGRRRECGADQRGDRGVPRRVHPVGDARAVDPSAHVGSRREPSTHPERHGHLGGRPRAVGGRAVPEPGRVRRRSRDIDRCVDYCGSDEPGRGARRRGRRRRLVDRDLRCLQRSGHQGRGHRRRQPVLGRRSKWRRAPGATGQPRHDHTDQQRRRRRTCAWRASAAASCSVSTGQRPDRGVRRRIGPADHRWPDPGAARGVARARTDSWRSTAIPAFRASTACTWPTTPPAAASSSSPSTAPPGPPEGRSAPAGARCGVSPGPSPRAASRSTPRRVRRRTSSSRSATRRRSMPRSRRRRPRWRTAATNTVFRGIAFAPSGGGGGGDVAPTIGTQPQDSTIVSGATATLTVAAAGTGPLSYQWYQGVAGDTSIPVGSRCYVVHHTRADHDHVLLGAGHRPWRRGRQPDGDGDRRLRRPTARSPWSVSAPCRARATSHPWPARPGRCAARWSPTTRGRSRRCAASTSRTQAMGMPQPRTASSCSTAAPTSSPTAMSCRSRVLSPSSKVRRS